MLRHADHSGDGNFTCENVILKFADGAKREAIGLIIVVFICLIDVTDWFFNDFQTSLLLRFFHPFNSSLLQVVCHAKQLHVCRRFNPSSQVGQPMLTQI